jgi:catechol 2,3-dioxygenase-like lactoylglutathione lyase family enzyme
MTELDHIAVIAPDLATGVAWVRDVLGVEASQGGSHPEMGIGFRPEVRLTATIATPNGVRVLN